jgi:hypothetical protein
MNEINLNLRLIDKGVTWAAWAGHFWTRVAATALAWALARALVWALVWAMGKVVCWAAAVGVEELWAATLTPYRGGAYRRRSSTIFSMMTAM